MARHRCPWFPMMVAAVVAVSGLTASSPPTGDALEATAEPHRLPSTIVPFRYFLFISVDVDRGMYKGAVQIYVNVLEDTECVTLHAAPRLRFEADNVLVLPYQPRRGERPQLYNVTAVERSEQHETVTLTLNRPLEKGKHYAVTFVTFEADLGTDPTGFHLASYRGPDGAAKWFAMTQFKPTHARKAFPCFDEPGFKARFDLQIGCHRRLTARSNMPGAVLDDRDVRDLRDPWHRGNLQHLSVKDAVVTEFDTTVPMPTYLLAWVVSDFSQRGKEPS